jgi:excisionase family DNA binding protein
MSSGLFVFIDAFVSERLLRPKEACQRLGISYSTLSRWVREVKIKAVRAASGRYPPLEVALLVAGVHPGIDSGPDSPCWNTFGDPPNLALRNPVQQMS